MPPKKVPQPNLPELPDLPTPGAPFRFLRKVLNNTRDGIKEAVEEIKGIGSDMRDK